MPNPIARSSMRLKPISVRPFKFRNVSGHAFPEMQNRDRRGRGVAPSNLFLVARKSSSPEELKTQFLDMVKRRGKNYGIVIRRMGDPAFRATDPDLAALMVPRKG